MRPKLIASCLPLAVALLLVGCSGETRFSTAKVRGKISYRNKPVPNGTVMFVPEGDLPAATGEISSRRMSQGTEPCLARTPS
jgi:hypothetical protein